MRESPLHPAIEATHRSQRSFGRPNLDKGAVRCLSFRWRAGGSMRVAAGGSTGMKILEPAPKRQRDGGYRGCETGPTPSATDLTE